MEIITCAIQKGGVAKTTTSAALAQAAAFKGFKVLALDLDPQGNLSFSLNAQIGAGSSYELLNGTPAASLIQTVGGVDIIPASWELSTLTSGKGSARRLQKAIEPIKENYDLIIIDTPTQGGELQYNALQASTGLLIPLQADIYNLQSLYQITATARQVQQSNPNLKIKGFVITKLDDRSKIARTMKENIIEAARRENIPYLRSIHTGIQVQEAAALQVNLFEYAPKSKPAKDYLELLYQII